MLDAGKSYTDQLRKYKTNLEKIKSSIANKEEWKYIGKDWIKFMNSYEKEIKKKQDFVLFYELYKEVLQKPIVELFKTKQVNTSVNEDNKEDMIQDLIDCLSNSLGKIEKEESHENNQQIKASMEGEKPAEHANSAVELNANLGVDPIIEEIKPNTTDETDKVKGLVVVMNKEGEEPAVSDVANNLSDSKKNDIKPLEILTEEDKDKNEKERKHIKKIKNVSKPPVPDCNVKLTSFFQQIQKIPIIEEKKTEVTLAGSFPNSNPDRIAFMNMIHSYYGELTVKFPKPYSGKFIFFEGSIINQFRNLNASTKKTHIISCQNPFKKDTFAIDYDIDSEEEYNENNAEDLNSDMKDDDDEEEELEEEEEDNQEEKWLVADDYLSEDENSRGAAAVPCQFNELLLNKVLDIRQNYSKPILFSTTLGSELIAQEQLNQIKTLMQARVFSIKDAPEFPLSTCTEGSGLQEENELIKYIEDVIRNIHYSFENSKDILKEKIFNQFKPKKKDIDQFFNMNVLKIKCNKTNEVSSNNRIRMYMLLKKN